MDTDANNSSGGRPEEAGLRERSLWAATLHAELRALAKLHLEGERRNHTLSATALVNEVYLKLSRKGGADREASTEPQSISRGVFFGLAAQAMRRILVDHARGRKRQKRGGGKASAGAGALNLVPAARGQSEGLDALALDEALTTLAREHEQAARVVELRFFAGLTDAMIAEVMEINERTVRRHWTFAKAWLAREMGAGEGGGTE